MVESPKFSTQALRQSPLVYNTLLLPVNSSQIISGLSTFVMDPRVD